MPRKIKQAVVIDANHAANEWCKLVRKLQSDIKKWAEEKGWLADWFEEREVSEKGLTPYTVSDLHLRTSFGKLIVEPIARNVRSADGRVDLRSFPSYNRMMLVRIDSRWVVKTDGGVEWPRKWNKRTFIELAEKMTEAA